MHNVSGKQSLLPNATALLLFPVLLNHAPFREYNGFHRFGGDISETLSSVANLFLKKKIIHAANFDDSGNRIRHRGANADFNHFVSV